MPLRGGAAGGAAAMDPAAQSRKRRMQQHLVKQIAAVAKRISQGRGSDSEEVTREDVARAVTLLRGRDSPLSGTACADSTPVTAGDRQHAQSPNCEAIVKQTLIVKQ